MRAITLLLIAALALFTPALKAAADVTATELAPLSESSGAIDWSNPNPSEVAYVGTRAGALFLMMAKAARTGAEEDQKIAEALERRALVFLAVGKVFELSTKTGTEEGFNKRLLLLSERYAVMMRESKELNNSFFPPYVKNDAEAANNVWPFFKALSEGLVGKK
jgi:hypothetical protein